MVAPISEFLFQSLVGEINGGTKKQGEQGLESFAYKDILMVKGMALEVLSISQLAMTGTGASSLEAGLSQIPFVSCYRKESQKHGSLANQVAGAEVCDEIDLEKADPGESPK